MGKAEDLYAQIRAMKPAERLRLAAQCLDEADTQRDPGQSRRLFGMAYDITRVTSTELGAAMAMMGKRHG